MKGEDANEDVVEMQLQDNITKKFMARKKIMKKITIPTNYKVDHGIKTTKNLFAFGI